MQRIVLGFLLAVFMVSAAPADQVSVAVAANFTNVAEASAPVFKAETGHDVVYSFGATSQLYTQIAKGVPFEVLLAADDEQPARAVSEGLGVEGSVFTYVIGALALYSTSLDLADGEAALRTGEFEKLAIADSITLTIDRRINVPMP